MSWQLIDYNGKLGITMGWIPDVDEPILTRSVLVHPNEKWDELYWGQFTQVILSSNNNFNLFSNRTYQTSIINTDGWLGVCETQPIEKPKRHGKNWDWEWRWGRWGKHYT